MTPKEANRILAKGLLGWTQEPTDPNVWYRPDTSQVWDSEIPDLCFDPEVVWLLVVQPGGFSISRPPGEPFVYTAQYTGFAARSHRIATIAASQAALEKLGYTGVEIEV